MKFTVEEINVMIEALYNYSDKLSQFNALLIDFSNNSTEDEVWDTHCRCTERQLTCTDAISKLIQERHKLMMEAEA